MTSQTWSPAAWCWQQAAQATRWSSFSSRAHTTSSATAQASEPWLALSAGIDARSEAEALGRITARCVYMPSPGDDRYFPAEEAVAEAALVGAHRRAHAAGGGGAAHGADWGHHAGDPHRPAGQEADSALIRDTVARLLAAPA